MAVGSKELAPAELDTFENDRLVDELKKAKEEIVRQAVEGVAYAKKFC